MGGRRARQGDKKEGMQGDEKEGSYGDEQEGMQGGEKEGRQGDGRKEGKQGDEQKEALYEPFLLAKCMFSPSNFAKYQNSAKTRNFDVKINWYSAKVQTFNFELGRNSELTQKFEPSKSCGISRNFAEFCGILQK